MENYIKCELTGGGSPRHLNTFSNLFIVVHYTSQHMLCIVAIVDCTHAHPSVHYKTIRTSYLVATVDCTHVGSATASRTLQQIFC